MCVTKLWVTKLCERDVLVKKLCEKVLRVCVCVAKLCAIKLRVRETERCERMCVTELCVCVRDKVVFEREIDSLAASCSVDVTKRHACLAKRRSRSPSATRATQVDVATCHACHAKCRWMSPSATPARQSAAAPRATNAQARHQTQPSAISATPATQK